MFNLKFEKMKKNMEMFKMNKTQMNKVNGGRIHCKYYDRENDKMYDRIMENVDEEVSANDATDELARQVGPGFNVVCWNE